MPDSKAMEVLARVIESIKDLFCIRAARSRLENLVLKKKPKLTLHTAK